jgi:hypothetical protein
MKFTITPVAQTLNWLEKNSQRSLDLDGRPIGSSNAHTALTANGFQVTINVVAHMGCISLFIFQNAFISYVSVCNPDSRFVSCL